VTGLERIIHLAWERFCPYEIYWGIVEDTEKPFRLQRKGPPRTVLSAMTKSLPTTPSVLPKKALWPR
jgi:hypothetical protein